jgi:hypothetical protein
MLSRGRMRLTITSKGYRGEGRYLPAAMSLPSR